MRISDWGSECALPICDAGRIVDGAVADVVAVDRRAAAEMVPVRGVEDIFVGPLRSRQHADDVARNLLGNLVVEAQRRLDAGQRHRLETFLLRRLAQRVDILARAGEKLLRLVELDPAVRGSLVGAAILAVGDRKSTRLNSSHYCAYRMPSSA